MGHRIYVYHIIHSVYVHISAFRVYQLIDVVVVVAAKIPWVLENFINWTRRIFFLIFQFIVPFKEGKIAAHKKNVEKLKI